MSDRISLMLDDLEGVLDGVEGLLSESVLDGVLGVLSTGVCGLDI